MRGWFGAVLVSCLSMPWALGCGGPSDGSPTDVRLVPPSVSVTDPATGAIGFSDSDLATLDISDTQGAAKWCVIEQGATDPAPETPDPDHACFSQTKPSAVELDALGQRTVYVFVVDTAGEVSGPYVATVRYRAMWVLGGFDDANNLSQIYTGTGGGVWTKSTKSLPVAVGGGASAVHRGKLFLLGGQEDESWEVLRHSWYSEDGHDWFVQMEHSLPAPRTYHAALSHAGMLWVLGGIDTLEEDTTAKSTVFASVNGTNWDTATYSLPIAAAGMGATVFQGKMWIAGGFSGTDDGCPAAPDLSGVYSTADGKAWTHEGDLPGPRANGRLLVFNDDLWFLGGFQSACAPHNTVWRSADGATWTEVGTGLPDTRHDGGVFAYNGKIWYIGGRAGGENGWTADKPAQSTIYSSSDGSTWTLERFPSEASPMGITFAGQSTVF